MRAAPFAALSFCFLLSVAPVDAAPPPETSASPSPTSQAQTNPVAEQILPGVAVRAGETPVIEVAAKLSKAEVEVLEFLAVERGGRDYESLLTLDCRPSALQAALLLIQCRPHEHAGTLLALELEWTEAGRRVSVPMETLLLERRTGKAPGGLRWRFTGSQFVKDPATGREIFLADEEAAFIGLFPNPALPVQLEGGFGNPYRGEQEGFRPNTAKLPPKDAELKLLLRKAEAPTRP